MNFQCYLFQMNTSIGWKFKIHIFFFTEVKLGSRLKSSYAYSNNRLAGLHSLIMGGSAL